MWSLDGGVNQAYLGAWATGTYYPGQIVIDNGIEYMCVRQTTKRPTPWAMNQVASYGTTLPTNPIDGQEATLVDNVTNPAFQWRFRFNANSTSAYKWEYVGGASYVYPITTIASWTQLNTWTVLIGWTVPRAGEYNVRPSLNVAIASSAAAHVYVGVGINNAVASGMGTQYVNAGTWGLVAGAEYTATLGAAGTYVQVMGLTNVAAQASATVCGMTVTPKRVA